jgi:hypothetical protein
LVSGATGVAALLGASLDALCVLDAAGSDDVVLDAGVDEVVLGSDGVVLDAGVVEVPLDAGVEDVVPEAGVEDVVPEAGVEDVVPEAGVEDVVPDGVEDVVLEASSDAVDVAGAAADDTAEPAALRAAWPVATGSGVPEVVAVADASIEPAPRVGMVAAARALAANEANRARITIAVAGSVGRRNKAFHEPETPANSPIPMKFGPGSWISLALTRRNSSPDRVKTNGEKTPHFVGITANALRTRDSWAARGLPRCPSPALASPPAFTRSDQQARPPWTSEAG